MLEYEVVQHVRKVGMFRNYNLNMCQLEFKCMITKFNNFCSSLQRDRKEVCKWCFLFEKNIRRVRIEIFVTYNLLNAVFQK